MKQKRTQSKEEIARQIREARRKLATSFQVGKMLQPSDPGGREDKRALRKQRERIEAEIAALDTQLAEMESEGEKMRT